MKLQSVMKDIRAEATREALETEIRGLKHDSRRVLAGDLFVAFGGRNFDGRDFVRDAVARGASAVMLERPASAEGIGVPVVLVNNARQALALASANFHGRPSDRLGVIGITGTNGKTTTAYLIKSMLEAAGHRVGLIGTVEYMVGRSRYPAPFTTPEAPEFQSLLSEMAESGCDYVATEVSSHALKQRRVDGTRFSAAAFTNLTPEHLDFHGGMEDYYASKKRLFTDLLAGAAVINIDDEFGRRLAGSIAGNVITTSLKEDTDLWASDVMNTADGLRLTLRYGDQVRTVSSRLVGMVNAYNIVTAVGLAMAAGLTWEQIGAGLDALKTVEGRFMKVHNELGITCVVDFAHTTDALERLIQTAREFTAGRVITVFGCGGDRDKTKRPAMGDAATRLSDVVYITSDNPRGEDPQGIIADILAGVARDNHSVMPDRREAIASAIRAARPGDTVLIAGKGHEAYQEIKGVRHPFSDADVADRAMRMAREERSKP